MCCNSLTSVQLTIEPVPQNAVKGESVLLLVHNLPKNTLSFAWFKSVLSVPDNKIVEYRTDWKYLTKGPAYNKRAMLHTNGSLLIQDVKETDAGFYTLQIFKSDLNFEMAFVLLHVHSKWFSMVSICWVWLILLHTLNSQDWVVPGSLSPLSSQRVPGSPGCKFLSLTRLKMTLGNF